jgi:hypothetical protein
MLYTICSKANANLFVQKFTLDCELEFAIEVSKKTFIDNGVKFVEIYEDRVPRGDLWGLPKIYVYREQVSDTRLH